MQDSFRMFKIMKKSAFTLAEIMIVLTVIGILTGILMPIAFHSAPDEDVMKFKKAYNMITTTIREMVNSDKYYLDGDLGIYPDGTYITDPTYNCNVMADILNAKKNNCQQLASFNTDVSFFIGVSPNGSYFYDEAPITAEDSFDIRCLAELDKLDFTPLEVEGGIVIYEPEPIYSIRGS